jgi:basic amino acid/polyamine antiporter, APA family
MSGNRVASDPPGEGPPGTDLRRRLGLLDAVGIGFGAIIGAGIFVVTGVAAAIAGPALLLGLLLAGAAAAANALTSAQLAAEYPRSGGTYEYGNRVLGPWAGFVAGWMFLASKIAAAGTVALGMGGYLGWLLPDVSPRAAAVGAIGCFTLLNYGGIRRTSTVNLLIVAVSLGALLIFAAVAGLDFAGENLRPFAPGGPRSVLEAAAVLFFAYTGYARIATLGEEVRRPARTIPLAIVITIGGSIILYLAVALAALGAVGPAPLADSPAPLLIAAQAAHRPWLLAVVATGGITAMLGVLLSQILGLSRMAFAMARRDDLPRWIAGVRHASGVPGRAVLLVGCSAAVVAAVGTLPGAARAASFTILLYYAIANLAALRMPAGGKRFPDAVPAFGLAACCLLAVSLPAGTIGAGAALLAAGVLYRLARTRRRRR